MEAVQLYTDRRHSACLVIILLALESTINLNVPSAIYPRLSPGHAIMCVLHTRTANSPLSVLASLLHLSLPTHVSRLSGLNQSLSHRSLLFCSPSFSR